MHQSIWRVANLALIATVITSWSAEVGGRAILGNFLNNSYAELPASFSSGIVSIKCNYDKAMAIKSTGEVIISKENITLPNLPFNILKIVRFDDYGASVLSSNGDLHEWEWNGSTFSEYRVYNQVSTANAEYRLSNGSLYWGHISTGSPIYYYNNIPDDYQKYYYPIHELIAENDLHYRSTDGRLYLAWQFWGPRPSPPFGPQQANPGGGAGGGGYSMPVELPNYAQKTIKQKKGHYLQSNGELFFMYRGLEVGQWIRQNAPDNFQNIEDFDLSINHLNQRWLYGYRKDGRFVYSNGQEQQTKKLNLGEMCCVSVSTSGNFGAIVDFPQPVIQPTLTCYYQGPSQVLPFPKFSNQSSVPLTWAISQIPNKGTLTSPAPPWNYIRTAPASDREPDTFRVKLSNGIGWPGNECTVTVLFSNPKLLIRPRYLFKGDQIGLALVDDRAIGGGPLTTTNWTWTTNSTASVLTGPPTANFAGNQEVPFGNYRATTTSGPLGFTGTATVTATLADNRTVSDTFDVLAPPPIIPKLTLPEGHCPDPLGAPKPRHPGMSADPVRYADGKLVLIWDDLGSNGLLSGVTERSYDNLAPNASGPVGKGWSLAAHPSLTHNPDGSISIRLGQGGIQFTQVNGNWVAPQGWPSTLVRTGSTWLYTLASGERYRFASFDGGVAHAMRGACLEYIGACGCPTTYTYTAQGFLESIERLATDSQAAVGGERITFSSNADGLIDSAIRWTVRGAVATPVRQAKYWYYTGAAGEFGERNNLKLVEICTGTGAVVDSYHYRYYREGQVGGGVGQLKYVINARTFDRMIANNIDPVSVDIDAGNATFGRLYDKKFTYETTPYTLRVLSQDMQGEEVDATGTWTYAYTTNANAANDPNHWKVKTIETMPGGGTITVYCNKDGNVLLEVVTDGIVTKRTWFRYDSVGREVIAASPAAITGFNAAANDLGFGTYNPDGSTAACSFIADSDGLISRRVYDTAGYLKEEWALIGETGVKTLIQSHTYILHTAGAP